MKSEQSSFAKNALFTTIGIAVIIVIVFILKGASNHSPAATKTSPGWETFSGSTSGATFQYPRSLGTAYVEAVDWPPTVAINDGPFTCTAAGNENDSAGKTDQKTINGRAYCVTLESGVAAGSVYMQYAYAFPENGKVAILTFSLRRVQCGNYDDPQKTACQAEQNSFDINPIADQMAQSLKISQ